MSSAAIKRQISERHGGGSSACDFFGIFLGHTRKILTIKRVSPFTTLLVISNSLRVNRPSVIRALLVYTSNAYS